MKKIILIISLAVLVLNSYSKVKIKPDWDTVYMFIAHNDTIILEPVTIPPGVSLNSNLDEVGSEYELDDDYDKIVAEFCKSKWIKSPESTFCVEIMIINNTIYLYEKEDIYTKWLYLADANLKFVKPD